MQSTQGHSRSFVPQTPFFFISPTTTPGSSYTIEGIVDNTRTTKKIKSVSGVCYTKTFCANLADKGKLEFLKQIESKQQILFLATTI